MSKTYNLGIEVTMRDKADEEELILRIERLIEDDRDVEETFSYDWSECTGD